jgi:hypothetical protein
VLMRADRGVPEEDVRAYTPQAYVRSSVSIAKLSFDSPNIALQEASGFAFELR